MHKKDFHSQTFEKNHFTENPILKGEYEHCIFNACDLLNADLAQITFMDCTFNSCNLSLAKLTKTSFQKVQFKDCKLLGLQFWQCNPFVFSVGFENCTLHLSSFFKLNLKKTVFKDTNLQEVDFTEADLTEAKFENCDLGRAIFRNTKLEKADFRTAFNYSIDPEFNRVKKAKFSITGIVGLLDKHDIVIE
jgi:fluoroquinolone resistance protein